MLFEPVLVDALPGCAWCLDVPRSPARPTLVHGARVEVFDDFFFEGAWAGPVDRPPQRDAAVYGTGASFRRRRVEVYTSIFKKHGVFLIETRDAFYLSNSMPLLMAYAGRDLAPSHVYCWHYHMALSLGWRGITVGLHRMPLNRGALAMFAHCRVIVDSGRVRVVRHFGPRIRKGVAFRDYVDMISANLEATLQNASASARRRPASGAIATLSAGYDSAAVAALGRQFGCGHGVTLDGGDGDSGAAIGEALGLSMNVVAKHGTSDVTGLATVLALPGDTAHTPWLAMRPFLRERAVLTGWLGDTMWSLERCSRFAREFASRTGFGGLPEARLWLDCMFVPIVATGDGDQDHVVELSSSDAMSPYRTGRNYDRPIPHRIAAEASVDGLIATQKRAGSIAKLDALPAAAQQEMSAIAGELRLCTPPILATVGRRQFALAGWECDPFVPGPRIVALEAIFRWAIRHLGREYAARLDGAACRHR
jgi:hypothetical protein